ncbi:COG4315 family predicted lipoprotein [Streptomyces sp. 8N616]|uniref:COG4315 family predicted lipoprotein n=1 Tax=Streptomyces sp. 8N616 TaxID=3457414 RepID=UPI003FD42D46
MRMRTALLAAPLVSLALLALSACGGDAGDGEGAGGGASTAGTKPDRHVSVKVADSEAGPILVDQSGRTLYGFTKDKGGASSCDADCIAVWPALTSGSEVKPGKGAKAALLRETERAEGVEQATYGAWPLYYYVGDSAPGELNGQGLDGEWFVVAADGKLIKKPV